MDIEVDVSHLDEIQHVNNVQYLQWVQEVSKRHWESEAKPEWLNHYFWVALSHHLEYRKPAFLKDQLKVMTHVHEFSGVKSHRLVRIMNVQTDQLLVQSSSWWCMINRANNKPVRLPQEVIELF